jgi:hypothetical protein
MLIGGWFPDEEGSQFHYFNWKTQLGIYRIFLLMVADML